MICLVRDIPVYYEQYGEGKPVLCIHGYNVDHRLMTGCLEPAFNKTGHYRRIYLDLPGMGRTPAAEWIQNADNMLELIMEFINNVIADENFLVMGESYGGYLTLGLISQLQSRIDGAMLICPVIAADIRRLPEKRILLKTGELDALADEPGVEGFLNMAVIATPEIYEKYKKDILPGVALADGDFLSRYRNEGYGFTFEYTLKNTEFHKPVTILTGRQDHAVGYSDAYEILCSFPRATFAVLDCAGHNLQIENESLFIGHLWDLLWRIKLNSDT